MTEPHPPEARDVIADRIEKWQGQWRCYDYADRLLKDLDTAGFILVQRHSPIVDAESIDLAIQEHGADPNKIAAWLNDQWERFA